MPRRIASISLLCAWLCASGAVLDVAQGVAWVRMFAGYAGRESVAAAARDTFDPAKACAICKAVGRARDLSCQHCPAAPAASAEKLVMICQESGYFVGVSLDCGWRQADTACPSSPAKDVPQPPPRMFVG